MFVNFRDFKGNTAEALAKMIADMRKFGVQVAKNCKPEHLAKGWGEVVCHLIDELLNIELFRRDYQFLPPRMPADDEVDELTDSFVQEDDPALHGTQELHGIQIKTTTDKAHLAGGEDQSPSKVHRNKISSNIEETKVNFFDPSKYVDDPDFQKPEEDQIIEAKVDAVEWRAELDRVYYDLVEIEKDLEVLKMRGAGDLDDDIEECRRHVDLIVDMCAEIKGVCTRDVTKVF